MKQPSTGLLAPLSETEFLAFLLKLGDVIFALPAIAVTAGHRTHLDTAADYVSGGGDPITALAKSFAHDFASLSAVELCERWLGGVLEAQQYAIGRIGQLGA